MIIVKNISKSYKKTLAVKDISFTVNQGELFGLIGPDGAGKSTIFRLLTTLLLPDAGTATVAGFDMVKEYKSIRKNVGYMPGKFSLYPDLSVEENLTFFATIFGTTIHQNYDLIKDIYVKLEPFKKRRAGNLSGGMKQKLALCCALIHQPKVLFLDEPTTGVDPVSRKEFWEMLQSLKQKNISILVSTAYMDEANLCDRIALIQDGTILQVDEPTKISEKFTKKLWSIKGGNTYKLLMDIEKYSNTHSVFPFGDAIHYIDKREGFEVEDLLKYLHKEQHQDIKITPLHPTIEDVFMDLVKQQM